MSEIEITGVFENVLGMIYSAKQKAEYQVNSTIIDLYWSIGCLFYTSDAADE